MAALIAIVLFAVSIQYQPSAARPLAASSLSPYHNITLGDSLLLDRAARAQRSGLSSLPRNSVTFSDPHSLLTTPKMEPLPATIENASMESLSIRTEFRTRRAFSQSPTTCSGAGS
jgi:hypothetical protein